MRPHRPDARPARRRLIGSSPAFAALLVLLPSAPAPAQVKSPAERLDELEKANEDLRTRIDALQKDLAAERQRPAVPAASGEAGEPFFSTGILTIGGVKLVLGGKVELDLIDPQSESDPIVGSTENPDPHFEADVLRLSPELRFNSEISLHAQVDFHPTDADTVLKELTARWDMDRRVWWFGTEVQLGLDDRFIRPDRKTEYYPLLGNAFWRRESVALTWSMTLGDKDGPQAVGGLGGAVESSPAAVEAGTVDLATDSVVVVRRQDPFDFAWNPGELKLYFSVGNGYDLGTNEVAKDGAPFNDLILDNRDLESNLSIREIGLGLEYRRSFDWLGEIGVLGFYYNDELSDDSVQFLEQQMTVRVGGVPQAGYGDVTSRSSDRFGVGVDYFLPASTLLGAAADTRQNDGLNLLAQWIRGTDDRLSRSGWFAQASYRYSFPSHDDPARGKRSRGLIANRYLRSVEPVVRYGILDVDIDPDPRLPGLWDRQELLLGAIVEISGGVFLKTEYVFHWEDTGASAASPGPDKVRNNELLVQLLLEF